MPKNNSFINRQSKAYEAGYDHRISGGDDATDNPWPDGSAKQADWQAGWEDANQIMLEATQIDNNIHE